MQFTDAQKSRWRRQVDSSLQAIAQAEVQVGDAELVIYTREDRELYKISEFGRMAMDEGRYTFFAAPEVIENPAKSKNDYVYKDLGQDFAKTSTIVPDLRPIVYEDKIFGDSQDYEDEKKLLRFLYQDAPVLHEPRKLTVMAAKSSFTSVVVESSYEGEDDKYRSMFRSTRERLTVVKEAKGLVYLGTALPKNNHERWIARIPSPYYNHHGTQTLSFQETRTTWQVSVKRKGKEHRWHFVNGELEGYGPVFIYPPSTLHDMGISNASFVVSSEPLGLKVKGTDFLYSSAQYLPVDDLHKRVQGDLQIHENSMGQVFDIKEWRNEKWTMDGTYYSRRARHPNLNWVGYQVQGRPVSFYSTSVPRKWLVRKGQWYFCGREDVQEKDDIEDNQEAWSVSPEGVFHPVMVQLTSSGQIFVRTGTMQRGHVLFPSRMEAQIGRWAVKDYRPREVLRVEQQDLSVFHSLHSEKYQHTFNDTNLQLSEGLSPSLVSERGLSSQKMQASGFVNWRGQWYHPLYTKGEIVTEGISDDPSFPTMEGLTYSFFFSKVKMKEIRSFFVGVQAQKVLHFFFHMGVFAKVKGPGKIKVSFVT